MDGTEPIKCAGIEVPMEERTPLVDRLLRAIEELQAENRRCRDTFVSLKKTCRKLGVSFWRYLQDRILGRNDIRALPDLMRQAAQET